MSHTHNNWRDIWVVMMCLFFLRETIFNEPVKHCICCPLFYRFRKSLNQFISCLLLHLYGNKLQCCCFQWKLFTFVYYKWFSYQSALHLSLEADLQFVCCKSALHPRLPFKVFKFWFKTCHRLLKGLKLLNLFKSVFIWLLSTLCSQTYSTMNDVSF